MANSVDPDETPRSAASHLGLHCLLRPVCTNTYGKYGICTYILSMNLINLSGFLGYVVYMYLCKILNQPKREKTYLQT